MNIFSFLECIVGSPSSLSWDDLKRGKQLFQLPANEILTSTAKVDKVSSKENLQMLHPRYHRKKDLMLFHCPQHHDLNTKDKEKEAVASRILGFHMTPLKTKIQK